MSKTKQELEEKKFTLRIPAALHEQLTSSAKSDLRSLNAQIVKLLMQSLQTSKD